MFPVLVLAVVLLLIALRTLGPLRLAIWQVVAGGALAVLASGHATAAQALAAIDPDVMVFLFGVFVLGRALEASGWLFQASSHLLSRLRSADGLLLAVILIAGLGSALLMNDTLAVIGTPLVLSLARQHGLPPALLLLALAFAVTTGSVMSPIGNPQNLLIALHGGMAEPFSVFFGALAVPTLLALALVYAVLRLRYHQHFTVRPLNHCPVGLGDPPLARLARAGLLILVAGVLLRMAGAFGVGVAIPLTALALAAAAPVLLFARARLELLRRIDWPTLVFFAALFVLTDSVWRTGVLQGFIGGGATDVPTVLGVGVLASQLVSNVPLVSLYLPLLDAHGAGEAALLALAAGSTLAGNLLLIGAASNVIVVQAAERQGGEGIGFFQFARLGVPLTALQVGVFWLFL